jgi:DNA-binding XRE family transcriptional regulator
MNSPIPLETAPAAGRRRTPHTELGQRVRQQFARTVRQLRARKGMTQFDLARAAGLGRSFVSQLERGRFSASLDTIAALATALGVPPSLLLT